MFLMFSVRFCNVCVYVYVYVAMMYLYCWKKIVWRLMKRKKGSLAWKMDGFHCLKPFHCLMMQAHLVNTINFIRQWKEWTEKAMWKADVTGASSIVWPDKLLFQVFCVCTYRVLKLLLDIANWSPTIILLCFWLQKYYQLCN